MEHLTELVVCLLVRVVRDLVSLELTAAARHVKAAVGVVLVGVRQVVRQHARQGARAILITNRDIRLPFRQGSATLRKDLHHAVGGVGAVQRTRCGALDDFHALNVFRGHVGQRETRDRAVNNDQRIGLTGDARRRAQTDGRGRTRLTRHRHHTRAGHLTAQARQRRRAGRILEGRGIDHGNRERRLLLRRRIRHAGDDDLLEVHGVLLEVEILLDAADRKRQRHLLRLVADVAHLQGDGPSTGARNIHRKVVATIK